MKRTFAISALFILVSAVSSSYAGGPFYSYPRTGQSACYTCTISDNNQDDGELLIGAAWPTPRFTDNVVNGISNGTVTDNLTGLVWLKNANCFFL
ncbi:MAG: hypothetical protein ACOYL3_23655 [Desulfuromonadaceae bacterium]